MFQIHVIFYVAFSYLHQPSVLSKLLKSNHKVNIPSLLLCSPVIARAPEMQQLRW